MKTFPELELEARQKTLIQLDHSMLHVGDDHETVVAVSECVRRLREVVPLLEEIQHDTRKLEGLRAETAYDNACKALLLVKGEP